MDSKLLEGYPLEQLRDYAVRDRLLTCVYQNHHRNGAPTALAGRFLVRFDMLIGLILVEGPQAVQAQFKEMRQEFGFSHHFSDILSELAEIIESP